MDDVTAYQRASSRLPGLGRSREANGRLPAANNRNGSRHPIRDIASLRSCGVKGANIAKGGVNTLTDTLAPGRS